jgi:hypothetical protein
MFHRKYGGLKENYAHLTNSVQNPLMPDFITTWPVIQKMNIMNSFLALHVNGTKIS